MHLHHLLWILIIGMCCLPKKSQQVQDDDSEVGLGLKSQRPGHADKSDANKGKELTKKQNKDPENSTFQAIGQTPRRQPFDFGLRERDQKDITPQISSDNGFRKRSEEELDGNQTRGKRRKYKNGKEKKKPMTVSWTNSKEAVNESLKGEKFGVIEDKERIGGEGDGVMDDEDNFKGERDRVIENEGERDPVMKDFEPLKGEGVMKDEDNLKVERPSDLELRLRTRVQKKINPQKSINSFRRTFEKGPDGNQITGKRRKSRNETNKISSTLDLWLDNIKEFKESWVGQGNGVIENGGEGNGTMYDQENVESEGTREMKDKLLKGERNTEMENIEALEGVVKDRKVEKPPDLELRLTARVQKKISPQKSINSFRKTFEKDPGDNQMSVKRKISRNEKNKVSPTPDNKEEFKESLAGRGVGVIHNGSEGNGEIDDEKNVEGERARAIKDELLKDESNAEMEDIEALEGEGVMKDEENLKVDKPFKLRLNERIQKEHRSQKPPDISFRNMFEEQPDESQIRAKGIQFKNEKNKSIPTPFSWPDSNEELNLENETEVENPFELRLDQRVQKEHNPQTHPDTSFRKMFEEEPDGKRKKITNEKNKRIPLSFSDADSEEEFEQSVEGEDEASFEEEEDGVMDYEENFEDEEESVEDEGNHGIEDEESLEGEYDPVFNDFEAVESEVVMEDEENPEVDRDREKENEKTSKGKENSAVEDFKDFAGEDVMENEANLEGEENEDVIENEESLKGEEDSEMEDLQGFTGEDEENLEGEKNEGMIENEESLKEPILKAIGDLEGKYSEEKEVVCNVDNCGCPDCYCDGNNCKRASIYVHLGCRDCDCNGCFCENRICRMMIKKEGDKGVRGLSITPEPKKCNSKNCKCPDCYCDGKNCKRGSIYVHLGCRRCGCNGCFCKNGICRMKSGTETKEVGAVTITHEQEKCHPEICNCSDCYCEGVNCKRSSIYISLGCHHCNCLGCFCEVGICRSRIVLQDPQGHSTETTMESTSSTCPQTAPNNLGSSGLRNEGSDKCPKRAHPLQIGCPDCECDTCYCVDDICRKDENLTRFLDLYAFLDRWTGEIPMLQFLDEQKDEVNRIIGKPTAD